MGCQIRKFISWLVLLGALVLAIVTGLAMVEQSSASAAIRQFEEAPGQVIYQSRQTLTDQYGNRWQAIAFKRILSQGETSTELRLVGFPGTAEIDHTQPLTLTNTLGKTLTAADTFSTSFPADIESETNVGQYNLQPLLPDLHAEFPLKLSLSTATHDTLYLSISSSLIQEWQTVFDSN